MKPRNLFLAACLLLLVSATASAHTYTVQQLNNFTPADINNHGQIAGHIGESFSEGEAAVWYNGALTPIGVLPGYRQTYVTSMNDNGQVVGYCSGGQAGQTAFLWQPGTGMTDLGILPGSICSRALAVNNLGQVVGCVGKEDDRTSRPFIWDCENGMRDLGLLSGCNYGKATDINDNGKIIGTCSVTNVHGIDYYDDTIHPFIQNCGSGMLGYGPTGFTPHKINNRNQVVGAVYGWYSCDPYLIEPSGKQVRIELAPRDMNNFGEIVGGVTGDVGSAGLFRGSDGEDDVLWSDDYDNGYGDILAINDHGQMITTSCYAGGSSNYLITLVPEPSSILILVGGVAGLTGVLRRRKM